MKRTFTTILILIVGLLTFFGCNNSKQNKYSYLKDMKVESLWAYSNGENQTIAFIDTGITNEANELYKNSIVNSYNVLNNSINVIDENRHGTQIISIAYGDGQKEVFGLAPKAKIMPIKALGEEGKIEPKFIEKAINYAIEKKATIINLSLGSFTEDENIKKSIYNALDKNITVVSAAGDYGQRDLLFPASMKKVISVEALNTNGHTWELSNTSEKNISTFPGQNIYALTLKNQVITVNGTSYSCALASGYIAIMRAYMENKKIDITNDKIINQMKLVNNGTDKKINYVQPIEYFNDSFANKIIFMKNTNPFFLVFMFTIFIFSVITGIKKFKYKTPSLSFKYIFIVLGTIALL